jgi:ubiquinone/menaquinone biosynthesis C-methylase UbiE
MSTVQADFDRLALLDDEGWTANNHYHSSLLKYLPANSENALEIGCGTGAFARQLAKRSKHVTALDLSPEMIRVARSRSNQFTNLEFELADALTWNFPKAHFDFVCSIATLHHLEQKELLLKVRESLKPGGVFVILDLVDSSSFTELVNDVVSLGLSGGLRLLNNGRLKPPAEVRKAWEQHGSHDSYLTLEQVRALADETLPNSTIKRLWMWRYLLVYVKPA